MDETSVGLDPASEMEVAPHSPNVTEHSSTELMKTDLPPKRPLEDDSITSLTMNSAEHDNNTPSNAPDYNRLKRPAKRVLRRARAHPSVSRTWNVFVGDLRSEVTEADLLHAFSGCGPINSVHIVRDSLTGQQRGFGFIHFKTAEAQLNALKEPYARQVIRGRAVRVCISDEKNTLLLHNLAPDWSAEDLELEITRLVSHVQSVEIRKRAFEPMSAVITFTNHDSGDKARRILAKTQLRGQRLSVTWAESGTASLTRVNDPPPRPASYPLYIWNLHATVDATLLRALFLQFMNGPTDHVGQCNILGEGRAVLEFSSQFLRARALKALANVKFRGCALYLATSPPSSSWPSRNLFGNHSVNTPSFSESNYPVNSYNVNNSAPPSPHRTTPRHTRARLDVGHEPPDISGLSTRPTKRARAPDTHTPALTPHYYHTPHPTFATPHFSPGPTFGPPFTQSMTLVTSFVPVIHGYQTLAPVPSLAPGMAPLVPGGASVPLTGVTNSVVPMSPFYNEFYVPSMYSPYFTPLPHSYSQPSPTSELYFGENHVPGTSNGDHSHSSPSLTNNNGEQVAHPESPESEVR
jgi:RNA recognition motif-containing protein